MELSPEIPDITASPQQLGHVFLNLINNAVEAMTGETEKQDLAKEPFSGNKITINTKLAQGKIIITVEDTGPGIPVDDMKSVFDPFFTKKKTRGIGIGLSTCLNVIEDHDGTIEPENSSAGGAVFKITLPVFSSSLQ